MKLVTERGRLSEREGLKNPGGMQAILGLTLEELCTIYRTLFPVLRQFEQDTWYDRNGRVAFTSNASLGIGLKRQAFEIWQECLKTGAPLPDDFDTQGLEPFTDPGRPGRTTINKERNVGPEA